MPSPKLLEILGIYCCFAVCFIATINQVRVRVSKVEWWCPFCEHLTWSAVMLGRGSVKRLRQQTEHVCLQLFTHGGGSAVCAPKFDYTLTDVYN